MIQILVYGTGVNKTFCVNIFGNYNAQHEHSQQKLLPGQKKKEKKKEIEHFCLFLLNLILFVATRVALIPRDRFCGIAVRWSYTIIPADKVNFFCANNALQILSFLELTLEFSKPLRYFSQRTTERCTSKPRFFFFFLSFFLLVFHCLCSTSSKTTRIVQHWEDVMFRPAPMRKWQHFRAQKHCRGNHVFVFLVYGRNKQDDVGLVSTSRRLYFGEASLQSPGVCTSKSIQYYFIYSIK